MPGEGAKAVVQGSSLSQKNGEGQEKLVASKNHDQRHISLLANILPDAFETF
jgi:hypothetical protein